MLKKLLMGSLAAGAMAVSLAGAAWADPLPSPNPPPVPNPNGQNPASPGPAAAPQANGLGPVNPAATPAIAGSNGQGPTCVVSATTPAQGTSATVNNPGQGAPATPWRQVATLEGSVASDLGLPPGQTMKVFCAPAGTPNLAEQPTTGLGNSGQTNPAQNPVQNQPGQTGVQIPVQGQQ